MTELLMAVAVSSLVLGGLAGIGAVAARTQARDYRHGILADNLNMAMMRMQQDIRRAGRIYQPTDYAGQTRTDYFYGSWCDHNRASNAPDKCLTIHPYQWPDLDFFWYCRVSEIQPDGSTLGKLYRYAYVQAAGEPGGPGTCGSGSPEVIATYVDTLTVSRAAVGYTRNSVRVKVTGTWTSPATGTESLAVETDLAFAAQYFGGP